jgi:predicted nucleotidyltransferase
MTTENSKRLAKALDRICFDWQNMPMSIETTKISDELRNQISEALKPLSPEKVILFGSYAWGQPTQDSDIDLYVVTHDEIMPSSWRQKRDIVRSISDRILNLRTHYSVDLLVHTKPMHKEFVERKSSFSQQIMAEGTRLL